MSGTLIGCILGIFVLVSLVIVFFISSFNDGKRMMGSARTKQTARKRRGPPDPRDEAAREQWIKEHKEKLEDMKEQDRRRKHAEARNALIAEGVKDPSYLEISRKIIMIDRNKREDEEKQIRALEERERILNTTKLDMYNGKEDLYEIDKYKYKWVEVHGEADEGMDIVPTDEENDDYNELASAESARLTEFKQYCSWPPREMEDKNRIAEEIAKEMHFNGLNEMLTVIYDVGVLQKMIDYRLSLSAKQEDQADRLNFIPRYPGILVQ